MANQQNNIMILDELGFARTIDTSNDTLTIGVETSFIGDLTVKGDLQISGDVVSVGQKDIVTEDAFLDLRLNAVDNGPAGFTAQIGMSDATRFDLRAAAAQFFAKNGAALPKIELTGNYTTGTQGFSTKELEFTGVPAHNSTVQIDDGYFLRTYKFITSGAAGNFDVDVSAAGDATAAATAFQTVYNANNAAALATRSHLASIARTGAKITFTSLVQSQQIAIITGAGSNTNQRDLFKSSALGLQADALIRITANDTIDSGGNNLELVFNDGSAFTLAQGSEFAKGGTIAATIDGMYAAIFKHMLDNAGDRSFFLKKNANSIVINANIGGTAGNAFTLSTNNAGAGITVTSFANGQNWLVADDVIAISGLEDGGENNGLFRVFDVAFAGGKTTIQFKDFTDPSARFVQTNFEDFGPIATDSATELGFLSSNIGLSVFCASDGALRDINNDVIAIGSYVQSFTVNPSTAASANGRTKIVYESVGNVTLQEAYDNGDGTITTDAAGSKPIKFVMSSDNNGFQVGGAAGGDGIVNFGGTGLNAIERLEVLGSQFSIQSDSTGAASLIKHVGGANQDLTIDCSSGSLNLSGGEAAIDAVKIAADNPAGGIDIDSGTGGITVDTEGSLSMQGKVSGDLKLVADTGSPQTLTISATNADAGATNVGNIDIDADGSITADALVDLSLQGKNAVDLTLAADAAGVKTLVINAANANGGGKADIDIDADQDILVDAARSLSLDAKEDSNLSLLADDAAAQTLVIKATNVNTGATALGHIDIDADGDITADSLQDLSLQGKNAVDLTLAADAAGPKTLLIQASNASGGANDRGNINILSDGNINAEAPTITIGTDGGAATVVTIGEGTQANNISINSGTGTFSVQSGDDASVSGKKDLALKVVGDALDNNAYFLSLHAEHGHGSHEGIILLGQDVSGTPSDSAFLSADKNIVGAGKASGGSQLYDSQNRAPLGIMMKAGTGGVAAGSIIALESNVLNGNTGMKADNADTNQFERYAVGVAIEAATAGNAFAMASVPGTIAAASFSGGNPAQADVGKPVYLAGGASAGTVSLTAPTGSGTTVFQVGFVADHNANGGLYPILLQFRFVAKRP